MSATSVGEPEDDATTFDDGTVRVRGILAPEDRAGLELTHFDTGTIIDGSAVWKPKDGDDDA
jgi:hypothetical protein